MSRNRNTGRVLTVALFLVLALVGLGVRLAFLHLGPSDAARARLARLRHLVCERKVGRGKIYDCRGAKNPLALDLVVKHVCADPDLLIMSNQVATVSTALARALGRDPAEVMTSVDRPGKRFA